MTVNWVYTVDLITLATNRHSIMREKKRCISDDVVRVCLCLRYACVFSELFAVYRALIRCHCGLFNGDVTRVFTM